MKLTVYTVTTTTYVKYSREAVAQFDYTRFKALSLNYNHNLILVF